MTRVLGSVYSIEGVHFLFREFYHETSKKSKKREYFDKYDTLLLITGSIPMNSEFNKTDNVVNNRVSYLMHKLYFFNIIDPMGSLGDVILNVKISF